MSDTTRIVLVALGVALLILALPPLLFMTGMMNAMMGRGMGSAWPIGLLPLLVLIAGIVLLAIGLRGRR